MPSMTVDQAEKNFRALVDQVSRSGESVDLEHGARVVARLTPARNRQTLTWGELNLFLSRVPSLDEDDVDAFANDIREVRKMFPKESPLWD